MAESSATEALYSVRGGERWLHALLDRFAGKAEAALSAVEES